MNYSKLRICNIQALIFRMTKELEDLRKKLAEEKKERNDKHVAHRNEMAILKAENEDLKRRVGFKSNLLVGGAHAFELSMCRTPRSPRNVELKSSI